MMNQASTLQSNDLSLARALLRLGLGVNIMGHGLARLPHVSAFVADTVHSFAGTFLPVFSVVLTAFLIPPAELVIGALLVAGLFQRAALILGTLLMMQLTFGTTLIQQWQVAGLQLIYIAVYAALISTLGFDRFSIDSWRRRA
jgi:thiosulfate dehydrogenase (quinone) large subunit